MEKLIILLISLSVLLIAAVCYFIFVQRKKIEALENEITNMRYIRVKENVDGSFTLTSQDGTDIFQL